MNLVTPAPAPAQKAPDFPSKIELGEASDVRPLREAFPAPSPAPKPFSGPEFEDLLGQQPHSSGLRKAALAGGGLALVAMVGLGVELSGVLSKPSVSHAASPTTKVSVPGSGSEALDTKKLTDQSELLDKAREFTQKRDFAKAEEIYRQILTRDPSNTEVKRLLASALFRQEKIDESVKVLNSISEDKQANNPGNEAAQ